MPIRLLRETILTSDRVETLDPPAEVFYRRLMSKVDDFGLFDARPSILRASLFPLRIDRVREADITRWIAACEKAGLIALYQHDGKTFMQMLRTGWQTRSEPKFPMPPWGKGEPSSESENNCLQPLPVAPIGVVGVVVESEGDVARGRAKSPPKGNARKTPVPDDFGLAPSAAVITWAAEKGFDRIGEHLEAFVRKSKAKGYTYIDWDLAFMEAIREDWAKLRGRSATGAAPEPEASHSSDKAVDSTKAWIADHSGPVEERSPEQRAATHERLQRAKANIVRQAA